MKKTLCCTLAALLVLALVLPCLMALAALVPNEPVQKNGIASVEALHEQGMSPKIFGTNLGKMDYFTDMIILSEALCCDSRTPLTSAMRSTMIGFGDDLFEDNYAYFVEGKDAKPYDYSWYWHGYLIWVRPLLALTTLTGIRVIQYILLCAMVLGIGVLAKKKLGTSGLVCFLLALLSAFFIVVPLSVQFSSVFFVALLSSLLLLWFPRFSKLPHAAALLLVAGGLASFLDLLTAPLITFGFPCLFFFMLTAKDEKKHALAAYNQLIVLGASWGIGFALIWIEKWLVGSLVLHTNILEGALSEASFMSVGEESATVGRLLIVISSFITGIFNVSMKMHLVLRLVFGLVLVVGLIVYLRHIRSKEAVLQNLHYLLIAALPILWSLVFLNHTCIHFWFVFRIYSVMVFGLGAFICATFSPKIKKKQ